MIAIAVVGWPLYRLVTSGDLDPTTALLRGAMVAGVCAYGVTLIVRLALRFEAEAEAERTKRLHGLYTDMKGAVADGRLTDQDTPAPGNPPPPGTSPPGTSPPGTAP